MSNPLTTSEQARADAMADADTLRLVTIDLTGTDPTWGSVRLAHSRRRLMSPVYDGQDAALAAHAAFLAVPGLRA